MFNWVDELMDIFKFKRIELSEAEAAEYIGRSVSTLRAYRSGRKYKRVPVLPCHRKGRRSFYFLKDLNDWKDKRGM